MIWGDITPMPGRGIGIGIAHRGARAFAPENTLPAFAAAAALGCTMVELDVHLSRDSQVVVHHDDDLLRCTNARLAWPRRVSYALADFSLAELKTLDAGGWFVDELHRPAAARQPFLRSLTDAERDAHVHAANERYFASGRVRIPSLADVLALAGRTGLSINVELKPTLKTAPRLAERTLAAIVEAGMADRVLISSFDPAQLARARALRADIAIGLLTDAGLPDPLAALAALGADALHPNADDPRCLDDVRAAIGVGRLAFPWTCNDGAAMRRLIAAGATGVITDYPNRAPDFTAGRSPRESAAPGLAADPHADRRPPPDPSRR